MKVLISAALIAAFACVKLNITGAHMVIVIAGAFYIAQLLMSPYTDCKNAVVSTPDTVTVTVDGKKRKLKLYGIHSQIDNERMVERAAKIIQKHLNKKYLSFKMVGDKAVLYANRRDVNEWILQNGLADSDGQNSKYKLIAAKAQHEKKGIFKYA